MTDTVLLPMNRDALAEMIIDDVAVATLLGLPTPNTLRDELPGLIHDRMRGGDHQWKDHLVFPVSLSDADFIQVSTLGSRVGVDVRNQVYAGLLRSVVAFLDQVDDADDSQTEADDVS